MEPKEAEESFLLFSISRSGLDESSPEESQRSGIKL